MRCATDARYQTPDRRDRQGGAKKRGCINPGPSAGRDSSRSPGVSTQFPPTNTLQGLIIPLGLKHLCTGIHGVLFRASSRFDGLSIIYPGRGHLKGAGIFLTSLDCRKKRKGKNGNCSPAQLGGGIGLPKAYSRHRSDKATYFASPLAQMKSESEEESGWALRTTGPINRQHT